MKEEKNWLGEKRKILLEGNRCKMLYDDDYELYTRCRHVGKRQYAICAGFSY